MTEVCFWGINYVGLGRKQTLIQLFEIDPENGLVNHKNIVLEMLNKLAGDAISCLAPANIPACKLLIILIRPPKVPHFLSSVYFRCTHTFKVNMDANAHAQALHI